MCRTACQVAEQQKSAVGCDYWVHDPDTSLVYGSCFAAFLANNGAVPVSVDVERAGVGYPVADFARIPTGNGLGITYAPLTNGMIQPGEVAILFLAHVWSPGNVACPAGVRVRQRAPGGDERATVRDGGVGVGQRSDLAVVPFHRRQLCLSRRGERQTHQPGDDRLSAPPAGSRDRSLCPAGAEASRPHGQT